MSTDGPMSSDGPTSPDGPTSTDRPTSPDGPTGTLGTVERLINLWRSSGDVVVLTGAGISTDSGIRDFRGPNGVWTRDPAAAALSDIDSYVRDPDVRRRAWAARRANPAWHASPNAGHIALARLAGAGRLSRVLTQNIDGLHQRAGSAGVLELHGSMWEVICLTCGRRWPTPEVLAWPDDDPACPDCLGILKTATVSFGQALDPDVVAAAVAAVEAADLLVAVGTTLTVHPVASFAGMAARLAIINAEETPYDEWAEVVVSEPISQVLGRIAENLTGVE